jgi:uncharacterized protein (DUF58 family)
MVDDRPPRRLTGGIRGAFGSLTMRGRSLLAAGVTVGVAGLILSERDLVRVAVLLIAIPCVAIAFAARTRFRLTCARRLEPARVASGSRSRVVLRIENISRLPTGLLLIEDTIPYLLGGRPRVVLDRLAPRHPIDVGYHVSGEVRGRYRVGPLTVRLMDPFGLCELPRAFVGTDTLVVTPQVVDLPTIPLTGEWGGAGSSTSRAIATHGDDDVATREYRHGDDLRRVHWRTTARRGELTVRREEQPWQSRGAVLLDTRLVGHRGDGPTSSMEWAISATASIGMHLAHHGFELRIITDTGAEISSAGLAGGSFDGALLDALAVTAASTSSTMQPGLSTIRHHGAEGLLIAVIGSMSPEEAESLARVRSGSSSVGVAFVMATHTWVSQSPQNAAAVAAHERTCQLLAQSGWRAIEVNRGDSIAELWALAANRGSLSGSSSGPAPTAPGTPRVATGAATGVVASTPQDAA